jgi:hypothetical protein
MGKILTSFISQWYVHSHPVGSRYESSLVYQIRSQYFMPSLIVQSASTTSNKKSLDCAVLVYFPRLSRHHAAFCLAYNTSLPHHPSDAGVYPHHYQSHQLQNRCPYIYGGHLPWILPGTVGHHSPMLVLLHRDHDPAVHCPCPRYSCNCGVAGCGDSTMLCKGVGET